MEKAFKESTMKSHSARIPVKQLATVALMFSLGAAASNAQQRPIAGSFSGTGAPSAIVVQPQQGLTNTFEYSFEGNGTLGPFAFRAFTASAAAEKPAGSTCAIYASVVAGEGVLRSQDGSVLMVNSATGTDCIEFLPTGPIAHCTRTFKIARGAGRFSNASGDDTDTITFSFTVLPSSILSGITDGQMSGTLSRVN
jgi:hypothetical protein